VRPTPLLDRISPAEAEFLWLRGRLAAGVARSRSRLRHAAQGEARPVLVVVLEGFPEDDQNGALKMITEGASEQRRVTAIVIIS
jgi:hypothetical protein